MDVVMKLIELLAFFKTYPSANKKKQSSASYANKLVLR
jgi:hypothetical protein